MALAGREAIVLTLTALAGDPNGARVLLLESLAANGRLASERTLTRSWWLSVRGACWRAPLRVRR